MQRKVEKKLFVSEDNCIWIGCVKLSLLRREYVSSAVNVLTNSYKVFISLKETFSNSFTFKMITKYGNAAVVQIATVFLPDYHVPCQIVRWNGYF